MVPPREEDTLDLRRALAIVAEVLPLPQEQRTPRAQALCAGDPALLLQVQRLLGNAAAPAADPGARRGRVGRYLIEAYLGRGGMGEVYRAVQDEPRRTVALKLLHPGPNSAAVLARFAREAEVLARLQHPGIVRIFDAGRTLATDAPEPYLAMEYVDGQPLLEGATQRGLDVRARVHLLAEICDAIEHAHQNGVIHRDLKPGNVLLQERNDRLHPRVLDFGIALSAADLAAPVDPDGNELLGTLPCMSPEQARGQVGVRSDVYSLGALGYELLAGRPPFTLDGRSLVEAFEALQQQEPPPLGQRDRRLRGDLEAIVGKALAKSPRDRYASAAELAADLRRHLEGRAVRARRGQRGYPIYATARWVQRRRVPALVLGLLLGTASYGIGTEVRAAHVGKEYRGLLALLTGEIGPLLERNSGVSTERTRLLEDLQQRAGELLASDPDEPVAQRVQASVWTLRGNLAREAGRPRECLDYRNRALDLLHRLMDRDDTDAELRHDYAIATVLRGDCEADAAAALSYYEVAHGLLSGLHGTDSDGRRANDDLAWSFLRQAAAKARLGEYREAADQLEIGWPLVEHLNRLYPKPPSTLSLRIEYHGNAADIRSHLSGDDDEVRHHRSESLRLAERLRAIEPDNLGYATTLISLYVAHGSLLRAQGDCKAARALLERGTQVAADLEQKAGATQPTLETITRFQALRATLASECEEPGPALAALDDAHRAAAALCRIDADRGLDRSLRAALGEAALRVLCWLDQTDADCTSLGVQLMLLAQRGDALPDESWAWLLFAAQKAPSVDLPGLLAGAATLPAPPCGLCELTLALAGQRCDRADAR